MIVTLHDAIKERTDTETSVVSIGARGGKRFQITDNGDGSITVRAINSFSSRIVVEPMSSNTVMLRST